MSALSLRGIILENKKCNRFDAIFFVILSMLINFRWSIACSSSVVEMKEKNARLIDVMTSNFLIKNAFRWLGFPFKTQHLLLLIHNAFCMRTMESHDNREKKIEMNLNAVKFYGRKTKNGALFFSKVSNENSWTIYSEVAFIIQNASSSLLHGRMSKMCHCWMWCGAHFFMLV